MRIKLIFHPYGTPFGNGELTVLATLPGLRELRVRGRRPSLPAELRIYAIGDIHGRLDLLSELLARISSDYRAPPTARPLYVFLGDYIDRGSAVARNDRSIDRTWQGLTNRYS